MINRGQDVPPPSFFSVNQYFLKRAVQLECRVVLELVQKERSAIIGRYGCTVMTPL